MGSWSWKQLLYLNANRCKDCINSISSAITNVLAVDFLKRANCVSFSAQTVVTRSKKMSFGVVIRSSRTPVTALYDTVILEHGHAEGVLTGIFQTCQRKIWKLLMHVQHWYVSTLTDLISCKARKMGLQENSFSYMVTVWCIAHKLQLAVLDSLKSVQSLGRLESTLKGV